MSLLDEARAAYERCNLERCRELVPRLIEEIERIEEAHAWDYTPAMAEHRIHTLCDQVERLESENATLRLKHNDPREATIEGAADD